MGEEPTIDCKRCNGCGLCLSVCLCNKIVMIKDVATIIGTGECDWCTNCEAVCPTGAIACSFEIVFETERS